MALGASSKARCASETAPVVRVAPRPLDLHRVKVGVGVTVRVRVRVRVKGSGSGLGLWLRLRLRLRLRLQLRLGLELRLSPTSTGPRGRQSRRVCSRVSKRGSRRSSVWKPLSHLREQRGCRLDTWACRLVAPPGSHFPTWLSGRGLGRGRGFGRGLGRGFGRGLGAGLGRGRGFGLLLHSPAERQLDPRIVGPALFEGRGAAAVEEPLLPVIPVALNVAREARQKVLLTRAAGGGPL